MNGAELPCGTVIGVEPADTNYKRKSIIDQSEHGTMSAVCRNPPKKETAFCDSSDKTNGIGAEAKLAEKNGQSGNDGDERRRGTETCDGDDEDLDDFFASLV